MGEITGPSILIAGAGAVGSVLGAMLYARGHRVTMLGRRTHLAAIAREGLEVGGVFGECKVRGLPLAIDPGSLNGRFDVILLCVKSYDTVAMADALKGWLSDDGVIVSMQNGLANIEALAARFGASRVLGARIIFGAEIPRPGTAHVTVCADPVASGPAPAIHGGRSARLEPRAAEIAAMIDQSGVPAIGCADVMPVLWSKVLYNVALNPLGALLNLSYGEIASDPDLRTIMDSTIDEAFAASRAMRIALPFADGAAYRETFYKRLIPSTFNHRPSMLYDLRRRGRTEIGALNGKIAEISERFGLRAETNRILTRLVRAAERARQAEMRTEQREGS
ncbi:MAG TPA: ketopantoate reductase family protein [Candidatus Binataceae bacterium]